MKKFRLFDDDLSEYKQLLNSKKSYKLNKCINHIKPTNYAEHRFNYRCKTKSYSFYNLINFKTMKLPDEIL